MRLFLLWLITNQIVPPTHQVFPQDRQTVQTLAPKLCVHTDLINEVDEWKIQRSLQLVREMGASTIVEFFPWSYVESSQGNFQWSQADRIIKHAEQQGIRIIARLGLVPLWARPVTTTRNYLTEEHYSDFANYTAAFAKRYAGRINHLIIWNEPNLAFEWGFQLPDPQQYLKLLKTVYQPIKQANLDAIILAGALAPTLEPEGSPNGINDLIFLDQLLEAGGGSYMDALAVHTYGFSNNATDAPTEGILNFRRAELIHNMLANHNLSHIPVFITESGWNDSPRWTMAVTPPQRVQQTLEALNIAQNNWDWAESLCIWILRYPRTQGNYRDNFTLITPEFQLKPLFYALQNYTQGNLLENNLWLPAPVGTS